MLYIVYIRMFLGSTVNITNDLWHSKVGISIQWLFVTDSLLANAGKQITYVHALN